MIKKPVLFSKILVISIIILLIGTSTVQINGAYKITSITIDNNGSLLGYVNDTSGNPIEGALVRVYFHETYEEDFSDSNGFYYVTNISICWCMKNATCSKEGYKTEWVLLSIVENTTYDFVLTEGNNPPDAPDINGPVRGKPGVEYYYGFLSTDTENEYVSFYIEWGDDTTTGWTDYYPSGEECVISHTWYQIDWDNTIRAKAKDINGVESDWSITQVPISKDDCAIFPKNTKICDFIYTIFYPTAIHYFIIDYILLNYNFNPLFTHYLEKRLDMLEKKLEFVDYWYDMFGCVDPHIP
ncbi:hypothetical protein AYK21_01025 [Thermoplasmatales archaeon SG8-52-2]|nr:MAG: hypothetical protein AYK21_01025 [Thermoplasmatales archaeon SG8-52-2]